jgi:hypothetical protein
MRYRNRDSGVEVDVAADKVMDEGVWESAESGSRTPPERKPPKVEKRPAYQANKRSDPPPKGGKGSDRQAWADYATSLGVEVDDSWTRDDIIQAVEEG